VTVEEVDVVIVGAGISGIGAAYYLQRDCPSKRYLILEGREAIGGTWDLFRYPGIRSDSDMFTLGYGFKPWVEPKAIAEGPAIKRYVEEAADENGIREHIRFGQRVKRASWSSEDCRWTLTTVDTQGQEHSFRAGFLMMCSGYYRYDRGHTPDFPGRERFGGTIVHPQLWPEDLDYRGKRVVVIGSGATAVTLIPSMADDAEHVVMLQRSPTYMVSAPLKNRIAIFMRTFFGDRLGYRIVRWLSSVFQGIFYRRARRDPSGARKRMIGMVRDALGGDYDVDKHFTPAYDPWDQRVCLVPDGDLFEAIKRGKASVETDTIETFTERGILLGSGKELEADIIITATGIDLLLLGGIAFDRDGEPIDFAKSFTYKGMMCSGVPNLVQTFGYINASWTLRADLTAEYACRVLNHMDATGARVCTPTLRDSDRDMEQRMWIDVFTPGYMQRGIHAFPRQGDREPWLNTQSYQRDRKLLRQAPIDDGVLVFEAGPRTGRSEATGGSAGESAREGASIAAGTD
jgi:cation diffusion facilitator CzcD-associated flavoprotein CzcO